MISFCNIQVIKMSKQQTILAYFQQHPSFHPTAEQVYAYVKQKEPSIGIATVYRNLHKLVAQGVLRELNLEKQGIYYDVVLQEHDHFICKSCGHIQNIILPSSHLLQEEAQALIEGNVISHQVLCLGICKNCLQKQK